jgi:hypothetical protein
MQNFKKKCFKFQVSSLEVSNLKLETLNKNNKKINAKAILKFKIITEIISAANPADEVNSIAYASL